ncbi:CoA pyrophosphatase [Aestuariibacter halophilus]|uniref:CoA pyrophosphatase n=1 Tax=Fluctibacter halophilus TaxID=226011 RepID=A0ABS8G4L2_9ALTE|nr:CoA pyrophosphatase [Aestuariibacter halophilus]MCC2615463.1 CoA pyrophosphatase [Aestuariibacter halophilus]
MNKEQFLQRFHHARQVQGEPDYPLRKPGKPAAVLMPILERDTQLSMLFTVRARHLKHHGGQISFPGGKLEASDNSLLDAALREAHEEIGLPLSQVQIVGTLPRYRTISGFEVLPFIGFVRGDVDFRLDDNEVDAIFDVPLDFLLNPANHLIHEVNRKGHRHPIYFIPWQDKHIWGATASFVRTLSHHVQPDCLSA